MDDRELAAKRARMAQALADRNDKLDLIAELQDEARDLDEERQALAREINAEEQRRLDLPGTSGTVHRLPFRREPGSHRRPKDDRE